jgi:hypothetical protein
MTVIPFDSLKSPAKVKEEVASNNKEDFCPPSTQSNDRKIVSLFPKNKKIVHFSRFLQLKQNALRENVKLRNGLVVKIHQLRRNFVVILDTLDLSDAIKTDLFEQILTKASEASDKILYSESSTVELLNEYWAFKSFVEEQEDKFANTANY